MASSRFLLDTNVLVWSMVQPGKLSAYARQVLLDRSAIKLVSVASAWELQIKHMLGKLPLVEPADKTARRYVAEIGAQFLGIEIDHIGRLYDLPFIHRDPFDRMLAAQAKAEGLTIVSPDRVFSDYGIEALW